jgi:biopolymer transport protein ExbD
MGAAVGAEGKGSVNVELNIVPFIDLMSCLTAFLLVTAVWVNIAQINIQPKGKTRDTVQVQEDDERVTLSILVQADKIWVGVSRVNEFQEIPKAGQEHNWEQLRKVLDDHRKPGGFFQDREDLEIAGESTLQSPVRYQDIVRSMDIALQAGFKDVGLSDPQGLAARPQL